MPLFFIQWVNSSDVKTPSPSVASTIGQQLRWNQSLSRLMMDADVGGLWNWKKQLHELR